MAKRLATTHWLVVTIIDSIKLSNLIKIALYFSRNHFCWLVNELTNEQTNSRTNRQTWLITISPSGGKKQQKSGVKYARWHTVRCIWSTYCWRRVWISINSWMFSLSAFCAQNRPQSTTCTRHSQDIQTLHWASPTPTHKSTHIRTQVTVNTFKHSTGYHQHTNILILRHRSQSTHSNTPLGITNTQIYSY